MNKISTCALLFCLWLISGCSKSNDAIVTGSVSINGEPVNDGRIGFFPVDGNARTAGARIQNGKYSASVPPGKAKVEIRVSKVVGQEKMYNTPNSETRPVSKEILPPKYNSETELELDVSPGENQKNFDLKTN